MVVTFEWIDKPVAGAYCRARIEWDLPRKTDIMFYFVKGPVPFCWRLIVAKALDTGYMAMGGGACAYTSGGETVLTNTARGYMIVAIKPPRKGTYIIEVAGQRFTLNITESVGEVRVPLEVQDVIVMQTDASIFVNIRLNRKPGRGDPDTMKAVVTATKLTVRNGEYVETNEKYSKTFTWTIRSDVVSKYIRIEEITGFIPPLWSAWTVRVCAYIGSHGKCGSTLYKEIRQAVSKPQSKPVSKPVSKPSVPSKPSIPGYAKLLLPIIVIGGIVYLLGRKKK